MVESLCPKCNKNGEQHVYGDAKNPARLYLEYIHTTDSRSKRCYIGIIKTTKEALSEFNKSNQQTYNELLKEFGAENKSYSECMNFLLKKGFTRSQARNAMYRYKIGGKTTITVRRTIAKWNKILDGFDIKHKKYRECLEYLMKKYGATYSQAKTAIHNYRKLKH